MDHLLIYVNGTAEGMPDVQLCSLAGSGTACSDQRVLAINLENLLTKTIVDLQISLAARDARLSIWVLPRPVGWLQSFGLDGLWHHFKEAGLTPHTHLARRQDWSFTVYADIARAAFEAFGLKPQDIGLNPEIAACLKNGNTPSQWRHSLLNLRKRSEYLYLFMPPEKDDQT